MLLVLLLILLLILLLLVLLLILLLILLLLVLLLLVLLLLLILLPVLLLILPLILLLVLLLLILLLPVLIIFQLIFQILFIKSRIGMTGIFFQHFFISFYRLPVLSRLRQSVSLIIPHFRICRIIQSRQSRLIISGFIGGGSPPGVIFKNRGILRFFPGSNAFGLPTVGPRPQIGQLPSEGRRRRKHNKQYQSAQPASAVSESRKRQNQNA